MNGQDIPVYCINLPARTDRRAFMEKEFRRAGWEATFVPALDGRTRVDLQELLRTGVLSPENKTFTTPLSRAEVACYLTHERVWSRIARARQPYAIICEDDIAVRDPPLNLRHLSTALPAGCDLLYLYYMNDSGGFMAPAFDAVHDRKIAAVDSCSIFQAWSCGGTQCYLITDQGVQKALASCRPIRHPVDGFLARMSAFRRMSTFALHPRAVHDAGLWSSIG